MISFIIPCLLFYALITLSEKEFMGITCLTNGVRGTAKAKNACSRCSGSPGQLFVPLSSKSVPHCLPPKFPFSSLTASFSYGSSFSLWNLQTPKSKSLSIISSASQSAQ